MRILSFFAALLFSHLSYSDHGTIYQPFGETIYFDSTSSLCSYMLANYSDSTYYFVHLRITASTCRGDRYVISNDNLSASDVPYASFSPLTHTNQEIYKDPALVQQEADEWCQSLNYTVPLERRTTELATMPDIGESLSFVVEFDTNDCIAEIDTDTVWDSPDGTLRAFWSFSSATPESLQEFDDSLVSEIPDTETSDLLTSTSDVNNDCPWSNVTIKGSTYCYSGPDADVGASYSDNSTRVDHYDGSYTVTDSQGNSVTYNADGTQQGTASNLPGAGPGGNGACPSWWCDDTGTGTGTGSGSGSGDGAPALPTEALDFTDGTSWDSGLSTSASCPPPMTVPLSLGSWSSNVEFSYQGFCDFASMIRALVIAAAYISAAFLVYRGATS